MDTGRGRMGLIGFMSQFHSIRTVAPAAKIRGPKESVLKRAVTHLLVWESEGSIVVITASSNTTVP